MLAHVGLSQVLIPRARKRPALGRFLTPSLEVLEDVARVKDSKETVEHGIEQDKDIEAQNQIKSQERPENEIRV